MQLVASATVVDSLDRRKSHSLSSFLLLSFLLLPSRSASRVAQYEFADFEEDFVCFNMPSKEGTRRKHQHRFYQTEQDCRQQDFS